MKILVADDDVTTRVMLKGLLSKWGYDVVLACDGTEALDVLSAEDTPRLAILDWMMPGADGPDICRGLKDNGKGSQTYVILVSARSDKEDIVEGLDAGADDFISKPFDRNELRSRIAVGARIVDYERMLADQKNKIEQYATHMEALAEERARQLAHAGKMTALGQLGAGLAHELNQPLTGILMYLAHIEKRDSVKSDDQVMDILEKAKQQLKRMAGVVTNLRTFARDTEPRYERLDINKPLLDALGLLRQQMIDHGIEVKTCIAENLPQVIGDANLLQSIFVNLIANAKDALDEMVEKNDKWILISSKPCAAKRMVGVTIEDNGPGMDTATCEKIFNPFFTTKPEGKGTGLGLSITHGIVKDHHAHIWVDSEKGKGTALSVFFPCACEDEKSMNRDDASLCDGCEYKSRGECSVFDRFAR